MSRSQLIIAVDIGTTHCKAVTINLKGKVIQTEKVSNTSIAGNDIHEQDPDVLLQNIMRVIQRSLDSHVHADIQCISFSAAMHGIMAVDMHGKPLTNLVTWADTRSKKYAASLAKTALGKDIFRHTGTPIYAMSPLCKIIWLRNERPEIFEITYKFISIKEYFFYKLFDKYLIDYSIASATGLFDIFRLQWYQPALLEAGISLEKLSKPVSPTHIENNLSLEQNLLFTNAAIDFVIGGNDGCLANLGCGVIKPNELALTIGTSGAIRKASSNILEKSDDKVFTYLLTENNFIEGGPTNNGGNILKWLAENVLGHLFETKEDSLAMAALAEQVDAGSNGLIFLPYIYGERAPVWDANARGTFFGLNSSHTKAHFVRAAFEGICFALFDIYKHIDKQNIVDTIYASGGFTESDFWLQMMTDVFGKKIYVNNVSDASAMGAAFIGMLATNTISSLQEAKKFLQPVKIFEPDSKFHTIYAGNFSIYTTLYSNLQSSFEKLASLNQ